MQPVRRVVPRTGILQRLFSDLPPVLDQQAVLSAMKDCVRPDSYVWRGCTATIPSHRLCAGERAGECVRVFFCAVAGLKRRLMRFLAARMVAL